MTLLLVSIVAVWLGLVLVGRPRPAAPVVSLDEPRHEWITVARALQVPEARPPRMLPERPAGTPALPAGLVVARLADAPGEREVHLLYAVEGPPFMPSPPPPPWRGR